MKHVYILPNAITAASLFCGMLAIYEIITGDLAWGCWMILLASFFDMMDGTIARLTRSASPFGLEFDSLSDLVAFGVAPAIMAYHVLSGEDQQRMAAAVCSLYTVFGAMRLARFNVQAAREEKRVFTGLPIPAAALAVMSLIWLLEVRRPIEDVQFSGLYATALITTAYLMVSKVPYYGMKSINLRNRQPFELLSSLMVIVFLLYLLKGQLDIVMVTGSWIYVLIMPALAIARHYGWISKRKTTASQTDSDEQTVQ